VGVRSALFSRQSHSHINRKRFVELVPALVPVRARSFYKPYEVERWFGKVYRKVYVYYKN